MNRSIMKVLLPDFVKKMAVINRGATNRAQAIKSFIETLVYLSRFDA
jgi:hypothetical protein